MTKEKKEMEIQEQELIPEDTERTRECRCYIPRTDIYEVDDEIVVVLDMPGINENSIDITVEKNILNVKGYSQMDDYNEYSLVFSEYEKGDYERSFQISNTIERENIQATFKNGVLKLVLSKIEQAKTRKIAVKAG